MIPVAYQTPAAILLVVAGVAACFYGYRFFRLVLALFGFIIGAFAASSAIGEDGTTWLLAVAAAGGIAGAQAPSPGLAAADVRFSCAEAAGILFVAAQEDGDIRIVQRARRLHRPKRRDHHGDSALVVGRARTGPVIAVGGPALER